MKVKNYALIGLFLLTGVFSTYAQCSAVDAGDDRTIVCGDSIYLLGQPKWSDGLDSTTSNFRGVFFTDSITGYTVGDNGIIHKTINGGMSWISQTSGVTNHLQAVVFTDANTGYVVGENGMILKTINGGSNWVTQTSGTVNTLYSVYFTDANTGIAVGTNGAILKTINAGISWSLKSSNTTSNLISVHFANANMGYISSDGKILKTNNGGENWKTILDVPGNIYIKIYFTDVNIGYVSCRDMNGVNSILKTKNGGTSWSALNLSSAYGISSMFFTDANTGYAGSVGRIFKTNDAGITWESQPVSLMNVEDIYFPTPRTGYAVGYGTTAKKTLKYTVPDLIAWTPAIGLSSTTVINPIASPTSSTTYTLTTKSGTCIQKDTIRITVASLTLDAGKDKKIVCGGSEQLNDITFNYKGKLKYSWLPIKGLNSSTLKNPLVTITQTTTYTLTIKTPNGCTATDSITVTVDSLIANAGSDRTLICGGSIRLPHVGSNYTGTGALMYSWLPTTGLDSSMIPDPVSDVNKETTYHVTITTPNGCSARDSVRVVVLPLKAFAGTDKTLICGGSAQLDTVASNYTGTGILTYYWTPKDGINNPTGIHPLVTITQPETFHVMVTTPNGCIATDSVSVSIKPLAVEAGIDKLHSCGDSVKFDDVQSNYPGTGALTYSWLPATGLSDATIVNPISTAAEMSYTLTIITDNGCKASDEVSVTLKKMNAIEICMVGMDSTEKNKISWNQPKSKVIDSVFIYKETNVLNNFIKIAGVAYAKGRFIDSTSQPNVKSEKYKISTLDSCGSESFQSTSHKTMHLSINKGLGTSWNLIWEGYEGFVVPTYSIYRGIDKSNLQFRDAVSGTSTQYTDFNPPPGLLYYQVEVINPHPCSSANEASIRSNVITGNAVGINELSNELNFTVYPNPANNELTLKFGNEINKILTFTIYDAIGAAVKTISIQQNQQQVDVSALSSGFYIVELKSTHGSSVQKLMIEK